MRRNNYIKKMDNINFLEVLNPNKYLSGQKLLKYKKNRNNVKIKWIIKIAKKKLITD